MVTGRSLETGSESPQARVLYEHHLNELKWVEHLSVVAAVARWDPAGMPLTRVISQSSPNRWSAFSRVCWRARTVRIEEGDSKTRIRQRHASAGAPGGQAASQLLPPTAPPPTSLWSLVLPSLRRAALDLDGVGNGTPGTSRPEAGSARGGGGAQARASDPALPAPKCHCTPGR
ncbi:hypothetical protein Esti_001288 [Eimeria stiedai]